MTGALRHLSRYKCYININRYFYTCLELEKQVCPVRRNAFTRRIAPSPDYWNKRAAAHGHAPARDVAFFCDGTDGGLLRDVFRSSRHLSFFRASASQRTWRLPSLQMSLRRRKSAMRRLAVSVVTPMMAAMSSRIRSGMAC